MYKATNLDPKYCTFTCNVATISLNPGSDRMADLVAGLPDKQYASVPRVQIPAGSVADSILGY